MAKITTIEGIGPDIARKLGEAGVSSVEALLKRGATKEGRQALAAAAGLSEERVLRWVNNADLMRVRGVGEEYAELLEAAGVDSVPELAQRNPKNLHEAMAKANAERKLVRLLPSDKLVGRWVEHARTLPRVVTH
ncbi:MAG: DUF4332 domain-containing protein [Gemmatimonadota bacterium]|nr:DUF4332 domain-containing protein [Gemmatimonadota bacterium]